MYSIVEVYNANDLVTHLKAKKDYIVIKGNYSKEVYNLIKSNLNESEIIGFELGSGGTINILASLINSFIDIVKNDSNNDETIKLIEKKLKLYKVVSIIDDEIVIKLKQLDY
ncbi:MAG: hypothetical protein J6D47_18305 [Peptostreptococcaceae bacterium]|nr:hypothetical protein [Peptostreptococcaceae bacterium]